MLAVTAVFIAYYMFFAEKVPTQQEIAYKEFHEKAEKYCNGPGSYTVLKREILDENNEYTGVLCIKSKMVGKSTSVSSQ